MVEQGIYFALGCIVTALAAMMFAPIFWRRALRLTRKRLQLQVPLSMQEILAERDQLRAGFAVERLQIEQAMAKVQATKAADLAALGRRSMEVTALREELTSTHEAILGHQDSIGQLKRAAAESSTQIGALQSALLAAEAQVETWRQRAHAEAAEQDRLNEVLETHRATIAGLETRSMGLEMRIVDAERSDAARLKAAEEGLRTRLEAAMGQATRHETSAISLRREYDDAKAHIRKLEQEVEAVRGRAQASQLEGSLRAGMARRGEAGDAAEGSDDDLRASIHALGLAVAMMSRRSATAARDDEGLPVRDPSPADAG